MTSDLTTIAWMQAKPGTKLHAELTKAANKKVKTPAQKLQAAIKRQQNKIQKIREHVAWCAEQPGQEAEVARWTPWLAEMDRWIAAQQKKLEAMGE